MIYLDSNATTRIDPAVVDAMLPFLTEHHGNPSSGYRAGRLVKRALGEARAQVARLLNAEPDEITFTSCGTEAMHAVFEELRFDAPRGRRIISARSEHSAVIEPLLRWQRDGGEVVWLPVDSQGRVDLAALEAALDEGPAALVTLMWANNETGVTHPVDEIVRIARARGVPVHTDAVQAVGKLELDVRACPVDYLSLSGHKFHAPKGVGALFTRNGARMRPWLLGGGQESGKRSGTENVSGIVALGAAAEIAGRHMMDGGVDRVRRMRDEFERSLIERFPDAMVHGGEAERLPNTCSVCLPGLDAAGLLILLDQRGVCASAGSACHSAALHPSHVLEAMGFGAEHAASTLRFSFSRFNQEAEVEAALDALEQAVEKMRRERGRLAGGVVVG